MVDKHIDFHSSPRVAAGRARGGRASQQDALVCLHDAGEDALLLVLADGMGGDGAGELAADGVVAVAQRLWSQKRWLQQPAALFLEHLCGEAHEELLRRRLGLAQGEPHSTVVALMLRGDRASWVHVGDSRLYLFQGARCVDRTRDHSLAEWRVQRGELRPEDVARHPDQHKLLRGLGGDAMPEVEHGGAMLRDGQSFALCSDGVWEHLTSQELGRLASRVDQEDALREALTLAVERGGSEGDNAALILVRATDAGRLRGAAVSFWLQMSDLLKGRRRDAAA
ncbi:PP2C family protein-serine/threonine phosphatase [Oleiagrimonas soli]|uniref:Serine/threonine protein phosphatase PrpC n=1 Tax=Oleiagrimonas soli TaxID=1543381 RepID=A0A841KDH9_9GAMM|nr:protein phosphatase 2C domain-containing protein [Oleiagrimonas soli]MBB6182965.1 serine/threonine protein phosphatase PrpC [Oleiagrimonas soli]